MFAFLQPPSMFEPPPPSYLPLTSPLKLIIHYIKALLLFLRGHPCPLPSAPNRISLVCISDTHTLRPSGLPLGDVLIHAGDLTNNGSVSEIQDAVDWIHSLPYDHKIVIAGNHDSFFDPRSRSEEDKDKSINWGSVSYLQHSSLTLKFPKRASRSLNFYGAPQIPKCGGSNFAFQYVRHEDAWSGTIPKETDVLITHTPPKYHLDLPQGLGCTYLLKEVWRVRPRIHVFGHVHAGRGQEYVWWGRGQAAWERMRERKGYDALDAVAWVEGLRVLCYGVTGVLWRWCWGSEANGGLMINAALIYRNTGQLGNEAFVVEI